MRIFRKERQSLRIDRIRAARALFMDGHGTEEIEVTFRTEEGDILTLQMKPHLAHRLVNEVSIAYQAICPPIRQYDGAAQWLGMDDQG